MPERSQIILETFARAIWLVDEAAKTSDSANASSQRRLLLWKAAAEAEYLALQISIAKGLGDYDPSDEKGNDENPHQPLSNARTLLEQAWTSVDSDTRRAYKATRDAVRILRIACADADKPTKHAGASKPRNE